MAATKMQGLPDTMARGALHILTSKGTGELAIRNPVAVKTLRPTLAALQGPDIRTARGCFSIRAGGDGL
jgi:hypothetical protein